MSDGRSPRRALVALGATLAIQVYTSLAATTVPVLAPEVARSFGVSPKLVGVYVGILYVGSMTASLVSGGPIGRWGAIRVSQACVLLCALGIALLPVAAGAAAALALAACVPAILGLGYGPITAASSQVLARTAPPSRMALTFSIKQTGVPAGAALAGAVLPAIALSAGWQATALGVAAAGALVALAAQAVRADFDRDRDRRRAMTLAGVLAPLREVIAHRRLADLSLLGFFYAAGQVCAMSFLVAFLAEGLGHSLVLAGAALSTMTVGGVAGRIVWGGVADRTRAPSRVLVALGLVAGACALAVAAWPDAAPLWPLFGVLALLGATAIGWNGVQLAEVARHAPPGAAGAITGASGFITFGGVVCGPPAFAVLASATGSYRVGFAAVGAMLLFAAALYALRTRTAPVPVRPDDADA